MSISRATVRVECCLYFTLLIILGSSARPSAASVIFPDDWEKIKSQNEATTQEVLSSKSEDNLIEADVAPAVPLEEPDMSEDDAEQFLDEFGIDSNVDDDSLVGLRFFDGARSRILRYQQQYGLNETGELDRDTKISLKSPKCGVSNVAAHGEDFKWSTPSLTYYVRNTPAGIASSTVKQILRNAFHQWSKVTNLDFVETEDPDADIEVVFGSRKHDSRTKSCRNILGDTTLAHSFYPQDGAIHFNTKFFPGSMNKDEFFTTAMHEIGHAIGLDHSVSKASLMYPVPVARFSEIPEPDVERIQDKYGKRQQLETTTIPTFCALSKYDAVMYNRRRKLIFISGKYCYSKFNSMDEPTLISEMWPGAPDTLDAAVAVHLRTYFFKGDQVWSFEDTRLEVGYPRRIREAFPGLPKNLDAVAFDEKKYIYAFKGDHYWRYNTDRLTVDLSDEVEDFGIPGKIDSAVFSNGKLFLFKDNIRHVYNFETSQTNRYDSPMFDC